MKYNVDFMTYQYMYGIQ